MTLTVVLLVFGTEGSVTSMISTFEPYLQYVCNSVDQWGLVRV